ncbi:MAG TPA: DUF6582 domain-containing protein, partial [Thermoplasmata archaeon]
MARPVRPARRRDGRAGPPEGYPKKPDKYADPVNWKYPVHTPFHARAARRYFNKPANRAKYTPGEQAYIDRKINDALTHFGIPVAVGPSADEPEAATIQADIPINKDIDSMTLDELLLAFLGENRRASAREMGPDLVRVDKESASLMSGMVKAYTVYIDTAKRVVEHDCVDFQTNRAKGRLFCKHLGAFLLYTNPKSAIKLLRRLLRERDQWMFG